MNARERFLRCMNFQTVDRLYNWELGLLAEAIDRWQEEGMPRDIHVGTILWAGNEFFGIDRMGTLSVDLGYIPGFDVEVVEETDRYLITLREDGILTKTPKRLLPRAFVQSRLAASSSILTRALTEKTSHDDQYLEFPVKCREDFENRIKWRLEPDAYGRYPMWWDDVVRCMRGRDYPLCMPGLSRIGLFSRLRQWMGPEAVCAVFSRNPTFSEEMLDFTTDFTINTLEKAVTDLEVDWFNWSEDYADDTGVMVPPAIFKEFLLPRYRRVNDFLRDHGVNIIFMEMAGNLSRLLPWLIEAGFTGIWPVECAAGMDPVKIRKEYGRDLQMMGGIDKRVLTKGRKAIKDELLHKIPDLITDGGYLPGLDQPASPTIPYVNWMYYLDLKRKLLAGEFVGATGT